MKTLRCIFFIVSIYVFIISINVSANEVSGSLKLPEFVAHAGGGIQDLNYTNSLQALNYNYNKGFMFFEVDLEWTLDKELVLIHDWNTDSLSRLFSVKPRAYSLNEFKGFKMINALTQMSLDDLAGWMLRHPDTYIITDIKSNNIEGLGRISKNHPGLIEHFIPQIYTFQEYDAVKNLGFKNIILTLYMSNYNDAQILDFLPKHKVLALTMLYDRVNTNFISQLKKLGVFIYVHTVNDIALKNKLKAAGIDGFYTDFLEP